MKNLWGGRFQSTTAEAVKRLNDSMRYDWRLWRVDIEASIAYAAALKRAGVLSSDEADRMDAALRQIGEDLELGDAELDMNAEDVHSAVENLLRSRIGDLAGKLHTGRSRNDQVATDTRLYLRAEVGLLAASVNGFQNTLVSIAEREIDTIMPGYTHLQHAQPVLLAHHLMAYFWMLQRDQERFQDLLKRTNVMPLGSGALAGSTVPLDREALANSLGFAAVSKNSLDAVSDRDFVIEFFAAASLLVMHLSRFAEEIVLWNTSEFGFIELSDSVSTGSSMMPQKKNPDVAELARAKTGRIVGHLVAMLTVMKGLPLSYNKDLQEDKEALFDVIDTLEALIPAFQEMLETASFARGRMSESLNGDFSTATDLADVLVKSGIPFRDAHEVVGRIVRHCVDTGSTLESLSAATLSSFSDELAGAEVGWEAVVGSIGARNLAGGTGRDAVRAQIRDARCVLGG